MIYVPLFVNTIGTLIFFSRDITGNIIHASSYDLNSVDSASPVSDELLAHYYYFIVPTAYMISSKNLDSVPMPIVLIDQDSDCEATIVQLSFGDRLGALLDTVM
ncbi:hypothetical protein TSUD_51130 [Trifolium subterraneum]|uniref:Uncharacterized protein n=1 Tax=Trifolium subterraneum TaxID=3900 RepID=A0A2Z6M781_TRISU|nr:hypothetical protein TSUD_51130 [Trifolium subterraneum]